MIPRPTLDNLGDVLAGLDPLLDGIKLRFWPWLKTWLANPAIADNLARIGGSVGISVDHVNRLNDGDERLQLAVDCCARTNAELTLNYSPWHYFYKNRDSRFWSTEAHQEIEQAIEYFGNLADKLAQSNTPVALIFLDQEILRADLDDDGNPDPQGGQRVEQAEALRTKNDLIFDIVKSAFPEVEIQYHGQLTGSHHTSDEKSDGRADTELYNFDSYLATSRSYADLIDAVTRDETYAQNGAPSRLGTDTASVMPWFGIGGHYQHCYGYEWGFTGSQDIPEESMPYPPGVTWMIARYALHPYFRGRGVASGRPDWGRMVEVGIWPTRHTEKYWANFVALIAGAHNIKDFESDWPKVFI